MNGMSTALHRYLNQEQCYVTLKRESLVFHLLCVSFSCLTKQQCMQIFVVFGD